MPPGRENDRDSNFMKRDAPDSAAAGPAGRARRRDGASSIVSAEASKSSREMPGKSQQQDPEVQYGEVARDLRSYVRSKLNGIKRGHDIEVEDVVQETFLRVWSSNKQADNKYGKGYLFRTARNLIIDIGRRRNIQPFDMDCSQSKVNVAQATASANLTPERQVSARQDLDLAMQVIDKLPENCRNAFCLQRNTGNTYARVASELNMSESMVQKHMARALYELHKVLP